MRNPSTTDNAAGSDLLRPEHEPIDRTLRDRWAPAPKGWRLWFYFGPRAGVHSYLAADLTILTIASFLTCIYVWVDQPGPSDIGKHSLSGLLVAIFGPVWARVGGVALFALITGALVLAVIAYARWLTPPGKGFRRRH